MWKQSFPETLQTGQNERKENDNFTIIAADHSIFSDDGLRVFGGKMWTDRCEKQQDTVGDLHLHHHAMCDDQCVSD